MEALSEALPLSVDLQRPQKGQQRVESHGIERRESIVRPACLAVLPYDANRVEEAGRYFDDTVRRIRAREFAVTTLPGPAICKECDLRSLCTGEGTLGSEGRGPA